MIRSEQWRLNNGGIVTITALRRLHCAEDACADCGQTIIVAVAALQNGKPVFGLECLFCPWKTDALPNRHMPYRIQ